MGTTQHTAGPWCGEYGPVIDEAISAVYDALGVDDTLKVGI